MRRVFSAVLVGVLLAACSGSGGSVAVDPVNLLVVTGEDGEVMTVAPDGSDPVVLSEDGTQGFQPVWSPDATHIAWGSMGGEEAALAVADVASGEVSLVETEANPFYLSWAPGSDRLGLLRNDQQGLAFEMATVGEDGVAIETVDSGAPYYFDWRPDGERVASHVGADRFDVLDLAGGVEETGVTPGTFQAPQWIERGILTIADDGGSSSELVLVDEGGDAEVVARVEGIASFAADPAGDRVAVFSFLVGAPDAVSAAFVANELDPNQVNVVDLDTGAVIPVTDELVAAFQWSPDGERLLLLQPGSFPGHVRWMVWSEEDGLVDGPEFRPTTHWVNDYLPFHDQYARSISLWSPDGSAFAFAGVYDDRAGIWRHDIETGDTEFVVEGTWVVWSPV